MGFEVWRILHIGEMASPSPFWPFSFTLVPTQFGAIVARSLPLTKTEEEMHYILEELTTLNKEGEGSNP